MFKRRCKYGASFNLKLRLALEVAAYKSQRSTICHQVCVCVMPGCSNAVNIVRRMAPGGIESLSCGLKRRTRQNTYTVSLEDTARQLIERWPALEPVSSRTLCLGARPGPMPVLRLVRILKELCPLTAVLHGAETLFHSGIAARLAGIPSIVHAGYAAGLGEPHLKLIARCLETVVHPRHICASPAAACRL